MGYFSQFAKGIYFLIRSWKMINKKKFFMLVLFIGLFLLLFSFNNKVFAAEGVVGNIIDDVRIQDNIITTNNNYHGMYIKTNSDYVYTIHLNYGGQSLYVTDSLDIGSACTKVFQSTNPYYDYTFVGSDGIYICTMSDTYSDSPIFTYTKTAINSSGVTNNLADELTLQNLWSQINPVVLIIGISVLFALGFLVFKKATKGTSKHQAKM